MYSSRVAPTRLRKSGTNRPGGMEKSGCSSQNQKSSALESSNLTLHDRRILENPLPLYAALRAARQKFSENDVSFIRAAGLGFGPRYSPSKGDVLPLDDPAISIIYQSSLSFSTFFHFLFQCSQELENDATAICQLVTDVFIIISLHYQPRDS